MPGGDRLDYERVLQGVRTLVPEEGSGLYRVRQDPSSPPLQGFNVHKDRALLVTPAISAINDLKDYGVNA